MTGRQRKSERAKLYESPVFKNLQARLAANVRRLRAARGWTQEDAAHACDMPLRLYQGVEGGKDNVTLVTLARLVEGFGVDVQDLLAPEK
ncbi:MAG: helix-turn-helix domain-containing protein [Acidobacteriota bacterium]